MANDEYKNLCHSNSTMLSVRPWYFYKAILYQYIFNSTKCKIKIKGNIVGGDY